MAQPAPEVTRQARSLDLTTASTWCWAEGRIRAFRVVDRAIAEVAAYTPVLIATPAPDSIADLVLARCHRPLPADDINALTAASGGIAGWLLMTRRYRRVRRFSAG